MENCTLLLSSNHKARETIPQERILIESAFEHDYTYILGKRYQGIRRHRKCEFMMNGVERVNIL